MASAEEILARVAESWRPPRRMSLSEWADKYAYLSPESSAKEGQWITLPYQRGIMDAITDPTLEMVVFMKSARLGYTKCLNNAVGYYMHQDPCSIMLVQPTDSDAEGYSKEEIAPMLRDTPVLRGLVAEAKSRDSGNTILHKEFPGGVLQMVGSESPRGLRRVSRRVILLDEVDGYPKSAGKEGDPVKLAIKRSEFFWNRKIVAGSTPTIKDESRIEKLFLTTDQRRYFVPCPHCNEYQYLVFGAKEKFGIKWPSGRPSEAVYVCRHCGAAISHDQKFDMVEAGNWRATAEAIKPGLAGFHLWAAYSYSPNATWGQLAQEWVESQGDAELLKTFINTALGETWEDEYTAKLDAEALARRAEPYELLHAPAGALVAVAGVDVQDNRVEVQVIAYGEGEEAWVVNYAVIFGDPERFEVWDQVLAAINTPIRHASGAEMHVVAAFVDSGDGNKTNEVYAFCRQHRSRHVMAIKGFPGARPVVGAPTRQDINIRGQKIKSGALMYPIGVDSIKSTLYSRLKRRDDRKEADQEPLKGPGVIHFPYGLHEDYYTQLTAEKQKVKYVNGMQKRYWDKRPQDRNEALDTMVYAYAALHYWISRHNPTTFWKTMANRLEKARAQQAETGEKVVIKPSSGKISLAGMKR